MLDYRRAYGDQSEAAAEVCYSYKSIPSSELHSLGLTVRSMIRSMKKYTTDSPHSIPFDLSQVDITATDAVVQLCLKLTESELKALLARMAEWRDFERLSSSSESDVVPHSDGSWQKYSRGVSFYHLISQLSARLKSIFLPSMVGGTLSVCLSVCL